jgi:hypothetical protein
MADTSARRAQHKKAKICCGRAHFAYLRSAGRENFLIFLNFPIKTVIP